MAKKSLRDAYILIQPLLNAAAFDKAAAQAGRTAGMSASKAIEKEMKQAGKKSGEALGEEIEKPVKKDTKEAIEKGAKEGAESGGNEAGSILASGIATGLAAIGIKELLTTSIEKEASNANLIASLGASPEEAKKYGKIAGDLYAGAYGESLDQVNIALAAVVRNGQGITGEVFSSKELQGYTADVLNLEAVFGESANSITQAASKMVSTGVAKNMQHAIDLITRGLQSPANASEDLLDSFNEYTGFFGTLGVSAEETLGLISQGVAAGARNSDLVVDAFKELPLRLQSGTDAVKMVLEQMGIDWATAAQAISGGGEPAREMLALIVDGVNNIDNPLNRATARMELFGSQGEDLGDAFGALDLSNAAQQIGNVDGAAAEVNKTLAETNQTRLTDLSRKFATLFSEQIIPLVLPTLEKLATYFEENQGAMGRLVSVLAFGATAIGVLSAGMLAHKAITTTWAVVTGIGTAAQTAFNFALKNNPIGRVIMLISAIVGALVWFFTKTELGQDIWKGLMSVMKDVVSWIWNTAIPAVGRFFSRIGSWFGDIFERVKQIWKMVQPYIKMIADGLRMAYNFTPMGLATNITKKAASFFGMADGGTVLPRPGGTVVRLAEAGKPESVVDTKNLNSLLEKQAKGNAGGDTYHTWNITQQPGESGNELAQVITKQYKKMGVTS